jgi:hypothetical protein
VLRGELPVNIPPTPTLNKVSPATGTVAVGLSLAAQTMAFLQAEVERLAAILVMSLPEQVLVYLLRVGLIDVLFRVASHRINPDRPNLLQARLVDL